MGPPAQIGKFEFVERIGKGTHGEVFKYADQDTGHFVAVKYMRVDQPPGENDATEDVDGRDAAWDGGIPYTAVREVSLLKELRHENVVRLFDVNMKDNDFFFVLEYVEEDLCRFLKEFTNFQCSQWVPKFLLYQMLQALKYLHENGVWHRDLKPSNMLIDRSRMHLKLADFGLARAFCLPPKRYSGEVVTLWYRAPELLLGTKEYSSAIDMWAVGCIFAEMVEGRPLFPGNHETEQLMLIFKKMGTPHDGMWPGVDRFFERNWVGDKAHGVKAVFPKFAPVPLDSVAARLAAWDPEGLDLLSQLLRCSPVQRISAEAALKHAYFHDIDEIAGRQRASGMHHLETEGPAEF